MALDNFIPTVWAARLLANLHKAQVFGQAGVANRDYEGDIAQAGDTVRINTIGPVTVSAYSKNTDISAAQTLADASTVLSIDQAKYFNFQIDDIDKAQQRPQVMDAAMQEAAYALSDAADQYLAGLYTDVDTSNAVGSSASPKTGYTAEDVYTYLVDLKVLLDNNNVPRDGRFVIVPPFVEGYLLKDDRFVKSGAVAPGQGSLANGQVGMAAGFSVMTSNNVSAATSTTGFRCIAGHPSAWTFASQINKIEGYRPPLRFADAVKGLFLYGAKVTRPSAMGVLYINAS